MYFEIMTSFAVVTLKYSVFLFVEWKKICRQAWGQFFIDKKVLIYWFEVKKKSTKLRLKAIDKQKSFYILLIFFLYTIMKFTHTHWGGTYCNWQHWFGPKFKGISTGKWKTAVMKFFPILYILKEIELSISLW